MRFLRDNAAGALILHSTKIKNMSFTTTALHAYGEIYEYIL
jgi:hypothetical protein